MTEHYKEDMTDEKARALYEKDKKAHEEKTTFTSEEMSIEEQFERLTPEERAEYQREAGLYLPYEQLQAARDLDDKQFKKLILALDDYLRTGNEPDFNGDKYLELMFKFFKPAIDSSFTGYVTQRLKSKRGGAPKGNQNARKTRLKPSKV